MANVTVDKKALIEGERPMYNTSYGKLMMWFFLVSDAFTFSGLLIAYGAIRLSATSEGLAWANPEAVFTHFPILYEFFHMDAPLVFVGLMTFILIISSVTMVLAVEAGHRKSKKEVSKWVFWTIIGGTAFLSCQAYEWYHFISGTPTGSTIVPVERFSENTPDLKELSYVELIPHGEGDDHSASSVSSLSFIDGKSIDDEAAVKAILKNAHHTHAGTYALSGKEARELENFIPNLDDKLGVRVYSVKNTEGGIAGLRLNNGYEIKQDGKNVDVMLAPFKGDELMMTDGGANLKANQYGPPAFADLFFFVTGFHGTHVFSGVVLLIILLINVNKGTYERRGHYEMTEKIGLYWHFVDLVWVFVFTVFYLV
ncbi:MAG: cytochrome c oxidase subunit 3 [Bacteroidia bacterium]|nr:cytochrome c oxidase subunit 3 [Bacteroidia bacterium]